MGRPTDYTRRTKERSRAVDVVFEADQRGRISPSTLARLGERRVTEHPTQTELPEYARTIVAGVAEHLAHIDYVISSYTRDWPLERMPAVDRAILRVATWEILYAPDVAAPVAISEAVKIAKTLSTDRSPGFINGLLDTVAAVAPGLIAQETELSADLEPAEDYQPDLGYLEEDDEDYLPDDHVPGATFSADDLRELAEVAAATGSADTMRTFLDEVGAPRIGIGSTDEAALTTWKLRTESGGSTAWAVGIGRKPVWRWPAEVWHAIMLSDDEMASYHQSEGETLRQARWRRFQRGARQFPPAVAGVVRFRRAQRRKRA